VVDNDMLGVVQRTLRGIEVSDETLAVDIIREVALGGPGHFLGHTDTLAKMETEYLYPVIADRQSSDMWRQAGSRDIQESARQRVRQVLSSHYPQYIDPGIDAEIRGRFPIQLAPEAMRAGDRRWTG
jgi:trimethylamine---corrinoid protein Co-methyltransferase